MGKVRRKMNKCEMGMSVGVGFNELRCWMDSGVIEEEKVIWLWGGMDEGVEGVIGLMDEKLLIIEWEYKR
ncbi:hypothetical protein, partial [Bacillus altitudinis]|uniref:hypothetical protein n=1 Tax=Bacillus altitudinis TaxID=293387 RepID=UPI001C92F699